MQRVAAAAGSPGVDPSVGVIEDLERDLGLPVVTSAQVYQPATGPLLPKVNVGAIEGGAPFKPNYFPGACSLYVDVRMPPHIRPITVQYEIERALSSLGIEYDMEVYRSLWGYEGKGCEVPHRWNGGTIPT